MKNWSFCHNEQKCALCWEADSRSMIRFLAGWRKRRTESHFSFVRFIVLLTLVRRPSFY